MLDADSLIIFIEIRHTKKNIFLLLAILIKCLFIVNNVAFFCGGQAFIYCHHKHGSKLYSMQKQYFLKKKKNIHISEIALHLCVN